MITKQNIGIVNKAGKEILEEVRELGSWIEFTPHQCLSDDRVITWVAHKVYITEENPSVGAVVNSDGIVTD